MRARVSVRMIDFLLFIICWNCGSVDRISCVISGGHCCYQYGVCCLEGVHEKIL